MCAVGKSIAMLRSEFVTTQGVWSFPEWRPPSPEMTKITREGTNRIYILIQIILAIVHADSGQPWSVL